jgi:hypothetical protein
LTGAAGIPPSGAGLATYSKSGSSFHGPDIVALGEVEHELYGIVGRDIAEKGIFKLAHIIKRFHEHVGVGYLAGQEMMERFLRVFIIASWPKRASGVPTLTG